MKVSNSSERLKELMEHFGIHQADICRRTGLQKATLSLYVRGERDPRQDKISLISDSYGVDPAWLMGYDVPMFLSAKTNADFVASINNSEVAIIEKAFVNADLSTKRVVAYALGLIELAQKYESEIASGIAFAEQNDEE